MVDLVRVVFASALSVVGVRIEESLVERVGSAGKVMWVTGARVLVSAERFGRDSLL